MSAYTKKKYVVKEVTEEYPLPEGNQQISKIVKPRGNNLHEILTGDGEECLASMPVKFRNHIWVKRGNYVITETIEEGKKVRAEIVKILRNEQIKHIHENKLWPERFNDCIVKRNSSDENLAEIDTDDELLFNNPNRGVAYRGDSSSEDSEESDESEEEESDTESDNDNEESDTEDKEIDNDKEATDTEDMKSGKELNSQLDCR